MSETRSTPTPDRSRTEHPTRPYWVIALCLFILLISLFHLLRFVLVLSAWQLLRQLPLRVSPFYLGLDGFIWAAAGLGLTLGLWRGSSPAWAWTQVLAGLYTAACWADLIWTASPTLLSTRWPFNLGLTILGLGFVYTALHVKASRNFFNR